MEPLVIHVGDLDVHVTVSERRRTVRLTVERDATVTAAVPPETDEADLAKAIAAKRPWLYAKLRERARDGHLEAAARVRHRGGFPVPGPQLPPPAGRRGGAPGPSSSRPP